MVGVLPDATRAGRLGFQREGDAIALLGPFAPSLAASELEKLRGRPLPEQLPAFDLEAVRAAQKAVRDAVREGVVVERPRHRRGRPRGGAGGVLPGGGHGSATVTVTAGEEP